MNTTFSRLLAGCLLGIACIFFVGCTSDSKRYIAKRHDLAPDTREAILQQQVTLGMFPDEAHAAAGQFVYTLRADKNRWGDKYFPPEVIFSQRTHPDDSEIEMSFCNRTQFNTAKPVSFTVLFRHGRATKITRNNRLHHSP